MRYRSVWFQVRWKGYDPSHDQWVKHSDVFADDAVAAFYRRYPGKPRVIAAAVFDSLPFRNSLAPNRTLRRGAAIKRGGDVRGTPAFVRSSWDLACDRARAICQASHASVRTSLPSTST
ncbi:unnamed protein product [Mycena citricolor]|uniref:Chromo domain-containing protein n=1 Tax=Mycena citricolor TaxID=2018698 RepID=A0AAD2HFX4_9AGAR|nr:unnamed protein product [Mycena citricolor]